MVCNLSAVFRERCFSMCNVSIQESEAGGRGRKDLVRQRRQEMMGSSFNGYNGLFQ